MGDSAQLSCRFSDEEKVTPLAITILAQRQMVASKRGRSSLTFRCDEKGFDGGSLNYGAGNGI
jgi:hypothetical protein